MQHTVHLQCGRSRRRRFCQDWKSIERIFLLRNDSCRLQEEAEGLPSRKTRKRVLILALTHFLHLRINVLPETGPLDEIIPAFLAKVVSSGSSGSPHAAGIKSPYPFRAGLRNLSIGFSIRGVGLEILVSMYPLYFTTK